MTFLAALGVKEDHITAFIKLKISFGILYIKLKIGMTKIIVDITFLTKPIIFSRLLYVLDFMTNHPCSPDNTIIMMSKDKAIEDIKIYYSDILSKEQNWIKPNGIFFLKKPGNVTQSKYCNTTFNGLNLQGFCADGAT